MTFAGRPVLPAIICIESSVGELLISKYCLSTLSWSSVMRVRGLFSTPEAYTSVHQQDITIWKHTITTKYTTTWYSINLLGTTAKWFQKVTSIIQNKSSQSCWCIFHMPTNDNYSMKTAIDLKIEISSNNLVKLLRNAEVQTLYQPDIPYLSDEFTNLADPSSLYPGFFN